MNELEQARNVINDIDKEMASLFERRMEAVISVANYKKANSMPILDSSRESLVIERNLAYIENDDMKQYYEEFIKSVMNISKEYQKKLLDI